MHNLGSDESSQDEYQQCSDDDDPAIVGVNTVHKTKQDNSFENRGSLHNDGYY